MSSKQDDTLVHTCKDGDCMVCEIMDTTKRLYGYTPVIQGRSAGGVKLRCADGHAYVTPLNEIRGCGICNVSRRIEEESHHRPIALSDVDNGSGYYIFRCERSHTFVGHKDTSRCFACCAIDGLAEKYPAAVPVIGNKSIIWNRSAPMRFFCHKCRAPFYASLDDIKGNAIVHDCDGSESDISINPISDTLLLLEKYYAGMRFDESEIKGDGSVLTVTGYNKSMRTAVVHTEQKKVKTMVETAVGWCGAHGIFVFKISAKDLNGIKKTLAQQICARDHLHDMSDVLMMLG
jgi:hypothetical protein